MVALFGPHGCLKDEIAAFPLMMGNGVRSENSEFCCVPSACPMSVTVSLPSMYLTLLPASNTLGEGDRNPPLEHLLPTRTP